MNNFKIINNIYQLNNRLFIILDNYPNKEKILKDRLLDNTFKLLEYTYRANSDIENRITYQKEILITIKMIDYYLKISCDRKIISYKKYISIGNQLLEINKMIIGWIKYKKD